MKIGVALGGGDGETLEQAVEKYVRAESDGFASAWAAHIFSLDALTVLALAGQRTSRIELGTAVVPTYPRHPHALAQQAATANVACGGRLALGIGRSHQVVIETMLGLAYDKPVTHMREYVSVLRSLLNDGSCSVDGKMYKVHASLNVKEARPVPILIGALMPKMLEVCGELCDGTLTWMSGPRYVETTVLPELRRAAKAAGRATPRVIVSLPVCVTNEPDAARKLAAKLFAVYGQLPVYRACLDAEGVAGPADLALVGDEKTVTAGLRRVAAAGATDFYAGVFPDTGDRAVSQARTYDFLKSLDGEI